MSREVLERSEALHRRVQCFVQAACRHEPEPESFEHIACDLARFQADAGTGLERLLRARGINPQTLAQESQIPAIPTDAFRLRRIACHSPEQDRALFRTSGTTAGTRGEHAFRTTATYEIVAKAWAKTLLFPDQERYTLLYLAPPPAQAPDSSLGFMFAQFVSTFGLSDRWLVEGNSLQVRLLQQQVEHAWKLNSPVLLAGAAFAFVHLLDHLGGSCVPLPPASRILQTGGFKAKSRAVEASELRQAISTTFKTDPRWIVGEYGMTELSSQAYEGTLRSALGLGSPHGSSGVYFAPPWMRVVPVDPVTLDPVPPGQQGIARIVDLANVDSAVAIQTADLVRCTDQGFELLGRAPGAIPRGCSLGVDELLGAK